MDRAPTPMRLFRWLRERHAAVRHDRAAEMGTAFGMELSLTPDSELPSAPAPLRAMQRHWLLRLAARRRAAG